MCTLTSCCRTTTPTRANKRPAPRTRTNVRARCVLLHHAWTQALRAESGELLNAAIAAALRYKARPATPGARGPGRAAVFFSAISAVLFLISRSRNSCRRRHDMRIGCRHRGRLVHALARLAYNSDEKQRSTAPNVPGRDLHSRPICRLSVCHE